MPRFFFFSFYPSLFNKDCMGSLKNRLGPNFDNEINLNKKRLSPTKHEFLLQNAFCRSCSVTQCFIIKVIFIKF